jgi:hypothetical protein
MKEELLVILALTVSWPVIIALGGVVLGNFVALWRL